MITVLFLSVDMIKKAEARTMENVSSIHLIENAAQALYNELKDFSSVRIYCGKGNNGSDGYATALLLKKHGIYTEIMQVLPPQGEECKKLCQLAIENNIPVVSQVTVPIFKFDAVLDAIFGIGISGSIDNPVIEKAIGFINTSSSYIVSADIPSGMNADTGEVCGVCVKADKTVTFTAPKKGMLENSSVDLCGEIIVADVGIGIDYSEYADSTCVPITDRLVNTIFPKRSRYSHKGTFGTAVIVAGSSTMPGACAMAAMAALKSGCGLVKIIAPVSICRVLNILVKEAIVIPVPEKDGIMLPTLNAEAIDAIKTANSILIGCGLGKGKHHALINTVLTNSSCDIIIDADGINALCDNLDIIRNKSVLLTPHPKEFSRISGYSVGDIETSRISLADRFAGEYGVHLLLKGARTVITYGGSHKYISLEATSALAKAGSGDVLAGITTSLSSQGLSLTDSAVAACLIHSRAGIIAEKEIGAYGTTADDLINLIPRSIKSIQSV